MGNDDPTKIPAIIIIRHAMDDGPGDHVPDFNFDPNVRVTIDDKDSTDPIKVQGNLLCPSIGRACPPAIAIALPALIEELNLQPVSRVLTILPPVTKYYERTPNPFMTIVPFVQVLQKGDTSKFPNGKLTFSLYSSHKFDTGDGGARFSAENLLAENFSTVISWEKTEMWALLSDKHHYSPKVILGSLAAEGYDHITSPQPVKGTSLYVYSGTIVNGRLPVKKYDLIYSDPNNPHFRHCGPGEKHACATKKLTCPK